MSIVAWCFGALACSSGKSASEAESPPDAAAPDASLLDAEAPRDAWVPVDAYAPSQPFEPDEALVTIPTGRKAADGSVVTVGFDLVTPAHAPSQAVLLLPGGTGLLALTTSGVGQGADNSVVRTRQAYAAAGLAVAVVDVPSDHATGLDNFRTTADHATDLSAIVAWMRAKWSVSVWMVGTSRGTISVANAAARLSGAAGPDGIVLTSSVTFTPSGATDKESISDVAIGKIGVPAQLVHNQLDQCKASPLSGAQALAGSLPKAVFVSESGGVETGTDMCGALTYHGFYGPSASEPAANGLDDEVVTKILAFLAAHR